MVIVNQEVLTIHENVCTIRTTGWELYSSKKLFNFHHSQLIMQVFAQWWVYLMSTNIIVNCGKSKQFLFLFFFQKGDRKFGTYFHVTTSSKLCSTFKVNFLCQKSQATDAQWSLFSLKSQTFRLGLTICEDRFWGIWGIFG